MKLKKCLKICYVVFTVIYFIAMPKFMIYVDSFRVTPGTAYGGELLLLFIPLIIYIAYKNYKDTPHEKDFED